MARTIRQATQRVLNEAYKLGWCGEATRLPADEACTTDDVAFDFSKETPRGRSATITAWMSGADYDTLIYDMSNYVDDCAPNPEVDGPAIWGREISKQWDVKDAIDDCEAECKMMYDFLEDMRKVLTNH